jgi:hypothetical protein
MSADHHGLVQELWEFLEVLYYVPYFVCSDHAHTSVTVP